MATLIPRHPGPQVGLQQTPNVRNTARVDMSPAINAAQQAGSAMQDALGKYRERAELTILQGARRELSEWERAVRDPRNPNGIDRFRGKDALVAGDTLLPDYDSMAGNIRNRLPAHLRTQFDMLADRQRETVSNWLTSHAAQEYEKFENAEHKATLDTLMQDAVAAGVSGDFLRQKELADEALFINRAFQSSRGMGAELQRQTERSIVSGVHAATIDGVMTTDPFAAQQYYARWADQMAPEDRAKVERALYPFVEDAENEVLLDAIQAGVAAPVNLPTTFDHAVEDVLRVEGGYVNDPDDKGGETNFGISSRANPDVDVANLTREEAKKLYRDRYWNAIDADSMPESIRAIAFDAAVNHGPQLAKQWAEEADGDLSRYAQLRRSHYARIVERDPSQRKFAQGWENRVARFAPVSQEAPRLPAGASEADTIAWIRENVRDHRRRGALERKARERFQLQQLREQESNKARDEHIYTSIETTNNPNRPLREIIGPEAYAWAVREGKVDTLDAMRLRKVQGTFVQDDPVMVEALNREMVLSPDTFRQRNLYEDGVVNRLSTSTLQDLLKAQQEANKPDKQAEWATTAERIDRGLVMLGIDRSGDATGKGADKKNSDRNKARGEFRLAYQNAEREFIQRYGKKPTPEQADALVTSVARNFSQRMAEGRLGMYSRAETFRLEVTPAEREEVRQLWRDKYGGEPTEADVMEYLGRLKDPANG